MAWSLSQRLACSSIGPALVLGRLALVLGRLALALGRLALALGRMALALGLWPQSVRLELAAPAGGCQSDDGLALPMHLTPQEKDKLLIVTAALLAERRLNRGLRLNHPEAVAWLSFQVLEGARDGKSVADLMAEGSTWLRRDQVMAGVPELVSEVQIEAVFRDGTKLVTLHEPIRA